MNSLIKSPILPSLEDIGLKALGFHLANTKVYLEYGCGGSTLQALNHSESLVVSVDSSAEWIKKLKEGINPLHSQRLNLLHAEIGEVVQWGQPANRSRIGEWYQYSLLPWKFVREKNWSPDLVFIDGRFRVACFCATYIASQKGAVVLFDDFEDRKLYHIILSLLKPVGRFEK